LFIPGYYIQEINKPVTYYSENTTPIINRNYSDSESHSDSDSDSEQVIKKKLPVVNNKTNTIINLELVDENIIRPYTPHHPSIKLENSFPQHYDLFYGANSYGYGLYVEKILNILTNPFCKSLNEKEIDDLILEILDYYGFHFKNIVSLITMNNNTNMELFFTFYIELIEKSEITINNKYLIENFLINIGNSVVRLDDRKASTHQVQLYVKLLEEYIKITNPSIIFFDNP
jgi:hypothetical protein